MKLEFYQEVRYYGEDEDSNEYTDGVHVHFECPACNDKYAGTDIYGNLYEFIEKVGDTFECNECWVQFKLISGDCWYGEYKLMEGI